ncbi:hypothetical protein BJ944DRAFT_264339 [Cunninghamella echinulata]|nr:hypothetical protein BJ944DRAFT_264339 [Cunninghamella echinulata]
MNPTIEYFFTTPFRKWNMNDFTKCVLAKENSSDVDYLLYQLGQTLTFIKTAENIGKKTKDQASAILQKWDRVKNQVKLAYDKYHVNIEDDNKNDQPSTSTATTATATTINGGQNNQFFAPIDTINNSTNTYNIETTKENTEDKEVNDYYISTKNNPPFECSVSPILLDDTFKSGVYHEKRAYNYSYNNIPPWPIEQDKWIVDDIDIFSTLKDFWATSSHLTTSQGNISDKRILSLHLVFPFMISRDNSITSYMDRSIHKSIKDEINNSFQKPNQVSSNLITWCNDLLNFEGDWNETKKKCFDIMEEAKMSDDETDQLGTYILFDIFPRITVISDEELCEDSFVHNYLHSFLDYIFSTNDIFHQSWANAKLNNNSGNKYKPDWTLYVKPWFTKMPIVTCEVKTPSTANRGYISDFVKLGLEMKDMLTLLLDSCIDDVAVFGILVEGASVSTYCMDIKLNIFRMIQLGSYQLITKKSQITLFPPLFSGLLQIRDLALKTAIKVESIQRQTSLGKRRNSAVQKSQLLAPTLKKQKKKNTEQPS